MKCPHDGSDLLMTERQGVEIDYCPQCRGVWLDRGELDKIIEKSTAGAAPQPTAAQPQHHDPRYNAPGHSQHHDPRYKKKKSMLAEIFDF